MPAPGTSSSTGDRSRTVTSAKPLVPPEFQEETVKWLIERTEEGKDLKLSPAALAVTGELLRQLVTGESNASFSSLGN